MPNKRLKEGFAIVMGKDDGQCWINIPKRYLKRLKIQRGDIVNFDIHDPFIIFFKVEK